MANIISTLFVVKIIIQAIIYCKIFIELYKIFDPKRNSRILNRQHGNHHRFHQFVPLFRIFLVHIFRHR